MEYKALSREEVAKRIMEGDIKDIWYANMKGVVSTMTTTLTPLSWCLTETLTQPTTVFFEIKDARSEIDITKRI